ncbi:hypothetical protein [Faecalibacter bovis]|uniref:Uncharacterized protein n=1 Tax=Faecalibacter bovis TaxID=2898187 RepID=A0ABX7XB37_9FLAO|nr:hypothetical protein [Faecalibacter bovis]QTV05093.1 hypothetical protein J9309_09860 [Faecalibacter bovis]
MKIGKKFKELVYKEYFFFIDNYKKYSDFNTLGLYRSLIENENLNINEKIQLREYAHKTFIKSFKFLQLKDPITFFEVSTLGEELTNGDKEKFWNDIKTNQEKILSDKRIKHRNFGTYSKHSCPYDDCIWQGVMIKQGSGLAWSSMTFFSDKNNYHQKIKSDKRKSERKNKKIIIEKELEN